MARDVEVFGSPVAMHGAPLHKFFFELVAAEDLRDGFFNRGRASKRCRGYTYPLGHCQHSPVQVVSILSKQSNAEEFSCIGDGGDGSGGDGGWGSLLRR